MRSTRPRERALTVFLAVLLLSAGCAGGRNEARAQRPETKEATPAPGTGAANLLVVDERVPPASDLEARLAEPRQELIEEMRQVVGHSARPLKRGKPEGLLGNLVADVMRSQAQEATGQQVDMAFSNLGGMRADLPAGPLTMGDVLEVMPFDNSLVVMELKGSDLQEVLDRGAMHGGDAVSGVSFRVVNRKAVDVLVGGEPLDPGRVYRICTNDYIVDGGGKYEGIKRARNVNRTGVLIRDALLEHIRRIEAKGRKVDSAVGGRIRP